MMEAQVKMELQIIVEEVEEVQVLRVVLEEQLQE
jgi:hypothetical protein